MTAEALFSSADLEQLSQHGISLEEATKQVEDIRSGFPFLHILASASLERGIMRVERDEEARYMQTWEDYLRDPKANVCKMVPASGAASRMFKSLYAFLDSDKAEPNTPDVQRFFDHLSSFAFYDRLGEVCLRNSWKSIPKLLGQGEYKTVVSNLLLENGLNYGAMPKGLLQFHAYPKGSSTAAEEHLVEGALYARDAMGRVRIHFTVSPEHHTAFESHLERARLYYEDKYGVTYQISYSEQMPSTDTLALDAEGNLFRREDGGLLFRPGGHGALINNLGTLDADIVFIKNIDNVVPDHLKGATIMYKKFLGGILIHLRRRIFDYLRVLERGKASHNTLVEIADFLDNTLCISVPEEYMHDDKVLQDWLYGKLNRPVRVCGMVRNQGEPGGGPFIIREADGSSSLQILESTQINMADEHQRTMLQSGGYFNPVDLVCSLRNHHGDRYDLQRYINPKTAFIASKSQGGRELKALERPGLWNGAMHDWNTVFVEVPIETFNPVKEVNDLLRPEHQSK
ncbi:MAG: DUF4301 family protein [Porphyromonadaceae bacterium]|nr:DUF4301 family protein [Porphyromonadaceae bacterium]